MSVKSELLKELEQNREKGVAGQDIATKLGVSRNAIWKAINSLREEGFEIESDPKKGYCLLAGSNRISKEGIQLFLDEEYRNLKITTFEEIDSTNEEAKRCLTAGERENHLFVSNSQTAGKGRRGRNFYSPKETGIYLSLLLQIDAAFSDVISITTAAAVVVVHAIMKYSDRRPQIKWVNDIYLDEKKVCGILTEAITGFEIGEVPNIIIGIGINISTKDFPESVSDIATSLGDNGQMNRNRLTAEIVNGLLHFAKDVTDKSYLEDYRRYSMVIGREVIYYEKEQQYVAKALGIDDDGGLIVENETKEQRILKSGEISLRLRNQAESNRGKE